MPRVLLVLLSSIFVACGGHVVVEDVTGGGGGGPGASGSSGSGGSGGAAAIEACAAFCDRRASDGCAPTAAPCEKWCPADYGFMGACTDAYRTQLECFASAGFDGPPACYSATKCAKELDALSACQYPAGPCESHTCDQTAGKPPYTCDHLCGGSAYRSECEGLGPIICTCRFDGETIGTCEDIDVQGTCCTQYFALWK